MTEALAYECLTKVIDPETRLNVVEMGLIREVRLSSQKDRTKLKILYTLTTPGCPLAGTFPTLMWNAFRDVEEGFEPERDIAIELTFDPPWSLNDLTPEARAELGL